MNNYIYIFLFIIISLIFSILPQIFGYLLSNNEDNKQKKNSYECGCDIFSKINTKFKINYYIIAILFIIFDIENLFFFTWGNIRNFLNIYKYFSIIFFLLEILIIIFYILNKKIFNL
ncbi:putative NADH:ubiquinone oxidoreductase, membrane subunit A [Candidatus Zinderia insecticola CARI]|uniref:NADH-quinone oxidoreductase subunit n=1 Tax=Zinderia insecticola (strain CARI) TaxID=871271 RepID=E0TIU9_ZINIC|nr:putative NADH:ubiquinone oxidoreductase, membrane subunit A [Candidatus Zinderia insecticola CARI]